MVKLFVSSAAGVCDNRLQNVVITLDKIKMFLGKPGQPHNPPLRLLSSAEVLDYLWMGMPCVRPLATMIVGSWEVPAGTYLMCWRRSTSILYLSRAHVRADPSLYLKENDCYEVRQQLHCRLIEVLIC